MGTLNFYNEGISKIENLPSSLATFRYSQNPIKYIDDLEIERFNNGRFSLSMYQTFKRLQRRICRRHRRNKAARIIQKGCHNWLYIARCKDGTVGIFPRFETLKLKSEGLIN